MCNCHTSKFKDFAYASQCNFRSLNDIQQVALAGCFGKRPGVLKFYDDLNADQLRSELNLRGVLNIPGNKKDNLACLKNHLQGVVRVPSLLILNPASDLQQLNLEKYCVLPFEPLHDLKSHINNVLQELPKAIHCAPLSSYLENFFKKPKIYGSDLREAIIQVLYILIDDGLDNNNSIYLLVESLVQICKISYSRDRKRSPRQCLQFYNVAYLHHELFVDIFKSVKGNLHIHSMACHGPVQHEIICSRSTNTEGEERLFKQATPAANNTDHKVENLAESLIVRLQCKLLDETTNCHQLVASEQSRIQKAAKRLPQYRGSVFTKSFIQKHIKSFQAHLERIGHFLLLGMGVWWLQDEDGNVRFTDGDQDSEFQPGGPELLHFREAGLQDVLERAKLCWQKILDAKIPIPLSAVRTYTSDGSALDVTIIPRAEETESDSTVSSEFVHTTSCEPSGGVTHLAASKEINGEDRDATFESLVCEVSCPTASTPLRKQTFPNTETEEESVQEEECVQEEEGFAQIDTCLPTEEPDPQPSPDIQLKSTLAKALVKVLGFNSDIAELDKVRSIAKSKPHATSSELIKYKTVARKLRKMVVQQMETIRAEMKQLEQSSSVANITHSGRYRVLERMLSTATKVYSNLV